MQHIDKIADDILKNLNNYKVKIEQKKKIESKIKNCDELISKMRQEEKECKKFMISLANKNEDKERRKEDIKVHIRNLNSDIENFENELFEKNTFEYEEMASNSELKFKELFGKLKVFFIDC